MNTKVVGVFASILAAMIIGMMLGQWSMRREVWVYGKMGRPYRTNTATSQVQILNGVEWVDAKAYAAHQNEVMIRERDAEVRAAEARTQAGLPPP